MYVCMYVCNVCMNLECVMYVFICLQSMCDVCMCVCDVCMYPCVYVCDVLYVCNVMSAMYACMYACMYVALVRMYVCNICNVGIYVM